MYNTYWGTDDSGKTKQLWKGTVIDNAMFKYAHMARQLDAVTLPSGSYIAKVPNDDSYVTPAAWASLDDPTLLVLQKVKGGR